MKKKVTSKTYQSIKAMFYATNIVVSKGDIRRISFDGGIRMPKVVKGKFNTSDEALQKAMEKDPAFNVKYKLVSTSTVVIDAPQDEPQDEIQEPPTMGDTMETQEFETGAAAKEWLLKTFSDLTSGALKNKATMVEIAKDKGIELVFVND